VGLSLQTDTLDASPYSTEQQNKRTAVRLTIMLTLPPFKPHPVIAMPTEAQVLALVRAHGAAAVGMIQEIERKRLEAMEKMERDRFRHGYIVPWWKRAAQELEKTMLLCVFGGNGAAKTVFTCWHGVREMVKRPGYKALFLHESETSSIRVHQKFIYDYLPVEWKPTDERRIKRTLTTKINYSIADGFSNNVLVLPNGSLAQFGFYGQDVGDYEGGGWNLIVADENLPFQWLKTLLIRLPRMGGKFIWTFTAVHGLTMAMKQVTDGAVTLESRRAPLLPPQHRVTEQQDFPAGEMPVVQQAVFSNARLFYAFSEDNPFGGYEQMQQIAKTFSTVDIERRFYGYARATIRTQFPLFGAAHVVPHTKIPTENVTRYHVLDPAGARNMFQLWCVVDAEGRHYITDEWPDVPSLGEWAVPAEQNARLRDGEPGPAQPSLGYGTLDYKRLILKREGFVWDAQAGWVETEFTQFIFQRLVDSRSGRAESMAETEGSTSLIDRFAEEQEGENGLIEGPSLTFEAASGQSVEHGIIAINDLLSYDPMQPITNLLNEPKLFVSDRCQNLIWALQNYTGADGEKAACKDPIDCLRYLAMEKLEHVPENYLNTRGGMR